VVSVLVADDSAVFQRLLVHLLDSDPDIHVVGRAADGAEAVNLALQLKPDVITMDVHMPVMDGFEATRRIMQVCPRPIVIVSTSFEPDDVSQSFRALEAGAVALLAKPPAPTNPKFSKAAQEIVTTVKLMAEVKVVTRSARREPLRPMRAPGLERSERIGLVAMAASTGGPAALANVLSQLPADLAVPVLVVQHISPGFEAGLVDWLQTISNLQVRLASSRLSLRAGEVAIAPTGRHLGVSHETMILDGADPVDGHRPSATYLFSSVAATWGAEAMGVILTGMGADGARGLLELRNAGGYVVAQDEATSIVYGMPGAAVELGAVDRIIPLNAIADAIIKVCKVQR
jgi:two-component system chemotaxis response regulator CheB